MEQEYLSDAELYYIPDLIIKSGKIPVSGNEFNHIFRVMRHRKGDEIFITDGMGNICRSTVSIISEKTAELKIEKSEKYAEEFPNITICLPKLRSSERLEWSLEKCIELGFTRFIIFDSSRTVKKGINRERINNLCISAMKQSMRPILPSFSAGVNLKEIRQLSGRKIVLAQKTGDKLIDFVMSKDEEFYLIVGPEGGLSPEDLDELGQHLTLRITSNRLRSDTAAVTAASFIRFKYMSG